LLYYLGKYYDDWQLERWHVFLDSPMAIRASKVYWETIEI
jgi:metallo-beta-lactamase family protein